MSSSWKPSHFLSSDCTKMLSEREVPRNQLPCLEKVPREIQTGPRLAELRGTECIPLPPAPSNGWGSRCPPGPMGPEAWESRVPTAALPALLPTSGTSLKPPFQRFPFL